MKLKKNELVNLTLDENVISNELTPQVAGGTWTITRTITVTVTVIPGDTPITRPGPNPNPTPDPGPGTYPGEGLPPY